MAKTAPTDARTINIEQLSKFFDHLVELVPARFYDTNDDGQPALKYMKKDVRMAEKKARKIKARAAKRAKLDPDQAQTALDIQKQGKRVLDHSSADESDENDDDSSDEDADARDEGAKPQIEPNLSKPSQPANVGKSINLGGGSSGSKPSMEDLKTRLAQRLEAMRQKRNTERRQEQVKKAKEWKEKALRQNKTKKSAKRKASEVLEDQTAPEAVPPVKQPVQNPDLQLTFGQLVFNEEKDPHKAKKHKKMTKAQLLGKAEKTVAEREQLAASDAGQEQLQKQAWSSAMLRARGEKILDDPKLLRKSMKKDEKLRKKKGAAWKEREQLQKKDEKDRQRKRRENLQKRVQDKQKRKIEKREKKLMRPGFEGRRSTSIN